MLGGRRDSRGQEPCGKSRRHRRGHGGIARDRSRRDAGIAVKQAGCRDGCQVGDRRQIHRDADRPECRALRDAEPSCGRPPITRRQGGQAGQRRRFRQRRRQMGDRAAFLIGRDYQRRQPRLAPDRLQAGDVRRDLRGRPPCHVATGQEDTTDMPSADQLPSAGDVAVSDDEMALDLGPIQSALGEYIMLGSPWPGALPGDQHGARREQRGRPTASRSQADQTSRHRDGRQRGAEGGPPREDDRIGNQDAEPGERGCQNDARGIHSATSLMSADADWPSRSITVRCEKPGPDGAHRARGARGVPSAIQR